MRGKRHKTVWSTAGAVTALAALVLLPSCKREARTFRVDPPNAQAIDAVNTSELHAGMAQLATTQEATSRPFINEYEENAHAMSEGKRLYESFNCVGCHFHGGGGIGPPLMDNKWIYGSAPDQVFATIIQGRPNGMPSFRGKIVDYQAWQIAAYVRSLSGLTNKQASGGREDHMQTKPNENSMPSTQPQQSFQPPSTEMPG
jgi:cytochrome c oxidase cbb3-type subunit 3